MAKLNLNPQKHHLENAKLARQGKKLGRRAIGTELNYDYIVNVAMKRLVNVQKHPRRKLPEVL